MTQLIAIDRVLPDTDTCNVAGRIVWTPAQSVWTFVNGSLGLIGVVYFASWGAAAVFVVLTFGENWHGNHHAFPHSAQLGVEAGQADPGIG